VAENVGVEPTTGLLEPSLRVIVTVEVATPSASTDEVPVMLEFATLAGAAVNVTVDPVKINGVRTERVLTSAMVEASVQVEVPVASLKPQTPYVLAPPVSVAEKVGSWPGTGLL
jgi:hypothetical protein